MPVEWLILSNVPLWVEKGTEVGNGLWESLFKAMTTPRKIWHNLKSIILFQLKWSFVSFGVPQANRVLIDVRTNRTEE